MTCPALRAIYIGWVGNNLFCRKGINDLPPNDNSMLEIHFSLDGNREDFTTSRPQRKEPSQAMKTLLAIYSYNRPEALSNCLDSVRQLNEVCDVVVYDDRSTRPEMWDILSGCNYPVKEGPGSTGRHGGLYRNMQMAYDDAVLGGYDYLINLQDDMQIVRPLNGSALRQYIETIKSQDSVFLVDYRFTRSGYDGQFDEKLNGYVSMPEEKSYTYSDCGFFSVEKLKQFEWQFDLFENTLKPNEKSLRAIARNKRMRKVTARTPIAMHIPFPELFRNGLSLPRLSRFGRKLYRYETMDQEAIDRMDSRPPHEPPNFRNFLRFENLSRWDSWLLRVSNDAKIF